MNGSGTARILSRLWLLVIAMVAITVLYLAKVLFLPLAFAILFAFLLAPVVTPLERMRMPRALAAILVILGFAALLGTATWMLFTQLVAVANDLPVYRDNITQKMEAIHNWGWRTQPRRPTFARPGERRTSLWGRRRKGPCRCVKWPGPPAASINWAASSNR